MNDLIEKLKALREEETEAKQAVEIAQDRLEATPEWQTLLKAKEKLEYVRSHLGDQDIEVRQAALDLYAQNGDKRPHPKVNIVLNTKLDYDPGLAIRWASYYAENLLKLNTRLFEKHVKAVRETAPVEFVTLWEEPAVRIARNL